MITPTVDTIWATLKLSTERKAAFTLMQLATIGLDGGPKARTIVLRTAEPSPGLLSFITDTRSAKVREIAANPRVSLCGYDQMHLQVRIEGRAGIVTDEAERRRVWASLRRHTRRLYDALPQETMAMAPADADAPSAFFCLVTVLAESIDWLDLSAEPHRRVVFRRRAGRWHGAPAAP